MNEFRQAIIEWAEGILVRPNAEGIFWEGFGEGSRHTAKDLIEFADEWFDNYMKEAE